MDSDHKHKVIAKEKDIRINEYLIGVFPSLPSRKSIKKALKRKKIYVDGRLADSALWINLGMEIELIKESTLERKIYPIELEVVFEDEHLAVVNKPAGLVSSGNQFRTLQNAISGHIKLSKQIDAIDPPLLVHRLDSATSGLVIIAKTASSAKKLGEMLATHEIMKKYSALLIGKIDEEGKIKSSIDNKTAISEYKRVKQIPSEAFESLSWVELYPLSGRTHQLRIHMADNNTPILGDRIHGKHKLDIKGKGLFLSAIGLEFTHPISQEKITIEIPEPKKFNKYWEWTLKRNFLNQT